MSAQDEQSIAESLDPDELPSYDDPEGALEYPADEPLGIESYGTTAAEERVGESVAEREARLEPEDDGPFAGVSEPDLDVLLDIEAEEDARIIDPDDLGRSVGRLGMPGPDDDDAPTDYDDESAAVAWAADEHDLSAEEAAVHITIDPAFGA